MVGGGGYGTCCSIYKLWFISSLACLGPACRLQSLLATPMAGLMCALSHAIKEGGKLVCMLMN